MTWRIKLTDPRHDAKSDRTNDEVASMLGVERRATVEETIAGYVRLRDGVDAGDARPADGRLREMRVDAVMKAILDHHRIDTLRLLHAGGLGLGFGCDVVHGGASSWTDRSVLSDEFAPLLTGAVHLADGVRYDHSLPERREFHWRTVGDDVHPDTVLDAMCGRPLREIMSHPIVDPLDLTVAEVRQRTGYLALTIRGAR